MQLVFFSSQGCYDDTVSACVREWLKDRLRRRPVESYTYSTSKIDYLNPMLKYIPDHSNNLAMKYFDTIKDGITRWKVRCQTPVV